MVRGVRAEGTRSREGVGLRASAAGALLFAIACATAPGPARPPAAPGPNTSSHATPDRPPAAGATGKAAVAPATAVPADDNLNAVLWTQAAAEHDIPVIYECHAN